MNRGREKGLLLHAKVRGAQNGFTLIELLVASAVLVLMLVFIVELLGHTQSSASLVNKQVDATQSARRIIDSLSNDMSHAVITNGATFMVGSTETFGFLKRGRGPRGASEYRYLAVQYKFENNAIIRGYRPVSWSVANLLGAIAGDPQVETTLGTGVLQMQIVAVLSDDTRTAISNLPTSAKLAGGSLFENYEVPENWTALLLAGMAPKQVGPKIVELIVTIIAVDELTFHNMTQDERTHFQSTTTVRSQADLETFLKSDSVSQPVRAAARIYSKAIPLE